MSYSDTVKRTWNDNRLMSVLLELTYACNLDCTFCYNDLTLGGQRLSLAQYRELLDDLASLGVLNLSLSGGEPLAHPRFFEIASHARSLGFVIRLKTNGHALKETVARRIREEVDPFLVEVSIHGATAETHDRQTRVPGSFERLVANIRAMKSLGLRVKANSVLTRWNEHEVEALIALCDDDLGVAFQIPLFSILSKWLLKSMILRRVGIICLPRITLPLFSISTVTPSTPSLRRNSSNAGSSLR